MSSLYEIAGDFRLYNYAENFYVATIKNESAPYVTIGAAETTVQLDIPFAHRIVKMIIRHTDNANADAITALDVTLRRDAGKIGILALGKETLAVQADLINSQITMTFGEGFEYERTNWTLAFTSTATHRLHILIYLQRLGKNVRG